MVHGINYGIEYSIVLNKTLDLYNDILPICIETRNMLSLTKLSLNLNENKYKLIIFNYDNLADRFYKTDLYRKYVESTDKNCYNHKINRKNDPEIFKYIDVKTYNNLIKYNMCPPNPISVEELDILEEKYDKLEKEYDGCYPPDVYKEVKELFDILTVQRVIANSEYFAEIKEMEHILTNIVLTDGEKEIINKVINHPNLEGAIESHGLRLNVHHY